MTLDQHARARAADLRAHLGDVSVPEPRAVIRRAGRRRRTTAGAAVAVVVVLLVSIAVARTESGQTNRVRITGPAGVELPSGAVRDGAWVMVPKRAAGIDAGAALNATTSGGATMLVAGTRRARDPRTATIWRSVDGLHWAETEHPGAAQAVTAIAMDGSRSLAVSAPGAPVPYVWSSDDAGRSWREIAHGELFGKPVPHNRDGAFVTGLVRYDGWWVAYGGAADGYEGIWTSRDGIAWKPVLDSRTSGGIDGVVGLADGSLMAYGVDGSGRTSALSIGWFTRDATAWGQLSRCRRLLATTLPPSPPERRSGSRRASTGTA